MTTAEINEAVAKKLGWALQENMGVMGCGRLWRRGSETVLDLPNYCGSIQLAFELLRHFDYLEITKGVNTDWLVKWGSPECAYAKTLPEAICLAFLRLP